MWRTLHLSLQFLLNLLALILLLRKLSLSLQLYLVLWLWLSSLFSVVSVSLVVSAGAALTLANERLKTFSLPIPTRKGLTTRGELPLKNPLMKKMTWRRLSQDTNQFLSNHHQAIHKELHLCPEELLFREMLLFHEMQPTH